MAKSQWEAIVEKLLTDINTQNVVAREILTKYERLLTENGSVDELDKIHRQLKKLGVPDEVIDEAFREAYKFFDAVRNAVPCGVPFPESRCA